MTHGWMDEIRDTTKLMIDDLREVTRDRIGWRQLIMDSTMMLMGHHITVQNYYLHLLIPKQNKEPGNMNIKHKLYSKISSFTLLQFRKNLQNCKHKNHVISGTQACVCVCTCVRACLMF